MHSIRLLSGFYYRYICTAFFDPFHFNQSTAKEKVKGKLKKRRITQIFSKSLGKYVQMLRLLDINHKDFEAYKLFGEFLCLPIFALQERENPKANYYTRTGNKCIVIRTHGR